MVSRVEGVEPISDKGAENPKQRDTSPLKIYLNWWEEKLFRLNWSKIARSGENGLKYFCPSAGRKEDEMFEKILIATDLSAASDSIVNCAEGFKKIGAEKVYLCHALRLKHIEDLKYQMIPMVEPKLKKQKDILERAGLKTEIIIAPGIPQIEINRQAEEKGVSLIVIGSHGESLVSHLFFRFGRMACEILHSHRHPLLLVRTKILENKKHEICVEASCFDFRKRVLFPTDFSDTSYRAFDYLE